jgi:hypothetical protein
MFIVYATAELLSFVARKKLSRIWPDHQTIKGSLSRKFFIEINETFLQLWPMM